MKPDQILDMMREIQARHDRPTELPLEAQLRALQFRSLDFSELLLRIEMESGKNLDMDAAPMRTIETVQDVLDFFQEWLEE